MAKIYWLAGDKEAARAATLQAIGINPDMTEALDMMSRISKPIHRLKWQRYRDIAEDQHVLFKRNTDRLTVTMLCEEDFAGSGFRIVESVRGFDPASIDIEQIVLRYGALGHTSGVSVDDLGPATVQDRINRSDIIHFKGDFAYNGNWNGFELPPDAKRIYTVGGSFFRREANPLISYNPAPLTDYVADYKSVLTPDLIYADDWDWTPHPWLNFQYKWERKKLFKIMHIPSDPAKKGTELINAAIDLLLTKRQDITYLCVSDITPNEAQAYKAYAHLYIDQMVAGAYGNAAIEAMQWGVPVVSWLGDYYPERVVQSPKELTVESLAECINSLLDWDKLEELSKATFDYAQRTHGNAGGFWVNKYKELANG
jgi:hypothetical protein